MAEIMSDLMRGFEYITEEGEQREVYLPHEIVEKIFYKHKGLQHPIVRMLKENNYIILKKIPIKLRQRGYYCIVYYFSQKGWVPSEGHCFYGGVTRYMIPEALWGTLRSSAPNGKRLFKFD